MPRPTHQVANPPSKTLLVYDGDCGFCKLWIARWREITAGAVDYEELQDAAVRFPEVPRAAFENAVKLIETDGRVFSGAEAVYRSLGKGGGNGFGRWAFEHVPGFAPFSNYAYAFIAGHRKLAHTVTSLFWGKDVRRPTYFHARRWFLRFLGVIYLIAFLSLWVQVDGLIGARGLTPVSQLLTAAHAQLGGQAYSRSPDALLAQSEQRVPAFSLRRRRGSLSAAHCRHRAHSLPRSAFRILSFAQRRGADVLQFSMGCPPARNGIPRHLPRALALVAEARPACAAVARRAFSPPFSSL